MLWMYYLAPPTSLMLCLFVPLSELQTFLLKTLRQNTHYLLQNLHLRLCHTESLRNSFLVKQNPRTLKHHTYQWRHLVQFQKWQTSWSLSDFSSLVIHSQEEKEVGSQETEGSYSCWRGTRRSCNYTGHKRAHEEKSCRISNCEESSWDCSWNLSSHWSIDEGIICWSFSEGSRAHRKPSINGWDQWCAEGYWRGLVEDSCYFRSWCFRSCWR